MKNIPSCWKSVEVHNQEQTCILVFVKDAYMVYTIHICIYAYMHIAHCCHPPLDTVTVFLFVCQIQITGRRLFTSKRSFGSTLISTLESTQRTWRGAPMSLDVLLLLFPFLISTFLSDVFLIRLGKAGTGKHNFADSLWPLSSGNPLWPAIPNHPFRHQHAHS